MIRFRLSIAVFFILLLLPLSVFAAADKGLYLKNITVSELENIYQKYGYNSFLYVKDGIIPPIFLEKFPSDFSQIKDNNRRNHMFIKILTPLALKINEEIATEREEILQFGKDLKKNLELTPKQEKRLEELALKYDAFTRLKGYRRHQLQIQKLRARIAPVPPSFLIAVSAIETNWGSSRIIKEGNALYKELSWYTDKGLVPQDEKEDNSYRIRTFPDLISSMRSYALKLNSNVSFDHMRFMRTQQIAHDKPLSGRDISHTMLFQTPLQNYIGILNYTITFYRLMYLDVTTLGKKLTIPTPDKPKKDTE